MDFNMVLFAGRCAYPDFHTAHACKHGQQRQVRQTEGLNIIAKIANKITTPITALISKLRVTQSVKKFPTWIHKFITTLTTATQWRQSNARNKPVISNNALSRKILG